MVNVADVRSMASSEKESEVDQGKEDKGPEKFFKEIKYNGDLTRVGNVTWGEFKKIGAMKDDYKSMDWFVSD